MRINTNVTSLNTLRQLGGASKGFASSVQKLSSGFRINKASDDAAGLGIANKIRSDVRSMKQASRNAEQATSLLQVAEGGAQTVSSIVDRMKELATQAGSDNVDDAGRGRIKSEYDALVSEIGGITSTTKFQGKTLLDGGFGNSVDTNTANSTALAAGTGVYGASISGTATGDYTITQAAAGTFSISDGTTSVDVSGVVDGAQTISVSQFGLEIQTTADFTIGDGTAAGSADSGVIQVDAGANGGSFMVRSSGAYSSNDLVSLSTVDLTTSSSGLNLDSLTFTGNGTAAEWQTALTRIDTAIETISTAFGDIGAAQNRIDYAMQNTDAGVENLQAAESVIRDVDMAQEVTQQTKFQILQQAATAMLGQANSAPQGVLRLLG